MRMALELCKSRLFCVRASAEDVSHIFGILALHQAWPKLLKRIEAHQATDSAEDRELVVHTRTWFCLYLFEHQ